MSRKVLVLIFAGLAVLAFAGWQAATNATVLRAKIGGRAPQCSWRDVLRQPLASARFARLLQRNREDASVDEYDAALGIERISVGPRAFWIKRPGRAVLTALLADNAFTASENHDYTVRPGDVVLDCGAHVGTFTRQALELGAARVIAVEPDPTNLECLRRNFEREVAEGRVTITPQGVWSSETTLALEESEVASSMHSAVLGRGGQRISIPVTTIDKLVASAALPRVDFMKLDVEGAEEEALKGAVDVLKRFRPRLMLDSYHKVDDVEEFQKLLPGYSYTRFGCRGCDQPQGAMAPNVTFWLPR